MTTIRKETQPKIQNSITYAPKRYKSFFTIQIYILTNSSSSKSVLYEHNIITLQIQITLIEYAIF
jgi:hypothetical protein